MISESVGDGSAEEAVVALMAALLVSKTLALELIG
jgi:hypothetical protein